MILNKPRQAGAYPDRDIECQEALEEVFLELAEGGGGLPDDITDAAGGNLGPVLAGFGKRAEQVGWTPEEAEVAISELSQNLLDDMGAM